MKNNLIRNFLLFSIFMLSGLIRAQSVSGVVSEATGPLPGASIVVKGSNNGVQTDFDGRFKLDNVSKDAILVVTFIGYVKQEIPVNGRNSFAIILKSSTQDLDEVVIVAYGTSKKKDVTGAVSTIKSSQLTSFPNTTVDQAIQGKTAGIQVTQNSGAPGASMSVNIRGVGSFGNTTPLYVIDGFPTQDISFLNPNDIASISVLKDASASALYGVRASNGVVIIETKVGTKNKLTVSVDNYTGIRARPKKIDLLSAQDFASYASEIGTAQGKNILPEWSNPNSLRNVDWQDSAFNSAITKNLNVSVRGGSDNLRASFSAGVMDQDGIVVGSSYKRYNIGFNIEADITKKLKVKTDIKYVNTKQFQNLSPGYYNLLKVFANVPYLAGTPGINVPSDGKGNYGGFTPTELLATSSNVIAGALRNDNDNVKNVVLGNLSAEYIIIPGLTAKGNLSLKSQSYAGWNFAPSYNISVYDKNPTAGYSINQNNANEYIAEGILDYNKTFGKHTFGLMGGISSQQNKYNNVYVNGRGFLNNDIRDMSQSADITGRSGTWGTTTFASTFARFNYNFDSKYYVTATVRRDGIGDRFGENNLYGVFPSFAAGWNVDQESFMKDSFFDVFKLRGSWGQTGSSLGIDPYQYLASYNNGTSNNDSGYVFGGKLVAGLAPISLANPDLQWETQIQTDFGIDLEMLDKRLYLTADWFNKESSKFLFQQSIPSQTGFSSKSVNGGNVTNKGLEVILGYRKTDGAFTWDVSANFTTIKNKIESLAGNNQYVIFESDFAPGFVDNWQGVTRSYVGGNVGTFYGYRADGIFQNQAEIDALNTKAPGGAYQDAKTAPGDRKFKDLNGDGKINGEDREVIGSPFPDFYGGLNLNAQYKGFELGIDVYASYGNEILNFARVELETLGGYGLNNAYSNVSQDYRNQAWTPENQSNTYSRAVIEDVNKNNRISDHFVEDGSFVRLRNIKLGYNLPSDLISNLGLSTAKIYISGQNLITLTKYTGWDPEIGEVSDFNGKSGVQSRGIDTGAYPITKAFTLGVSLQF